LLKDFILYSLVLEYVSAPPLLTKQAPLTSLKRMGLGIVFTSSAMLVSGFVQLAVTNSPANSVSVLWIIPQIFLVSCGEVLLSVTAYEFAYTQAPKNMKGKKIKCRFT
jgi:POT family proton-dependent oligopeptide transporter